MQPRKMIFAAAFATAAIAVSVSGQSLPADSVLARALVFRSIGPAVMSGRISDLAIVQPKSGHGGLGTCL
jgi:hypothetical protein